MTDLLVHGGCTVGMIAMCLQLELGFRELHIYGMDSCHAGGKHHAYRQDSNDTDKVEQVWIGEREFWCSGWQQRQIVDFQRLIQDHGDNFRTVMHGDGALTHVVREAVKNFKIKQAELLGEAEAA